MLGTSIGESQMRLNLFSKIEKTFGIPKDFCECQHKFQNV